jgi:5-(carboxyamino)imidazole ribonucleotide mutase
MSNFVGIVMGSDSDYPLVVDTLKILKRFDVPFEVSVISAHRDTERALAYATSAIDRKMDIIIAFAGMAAHLGQDALLSTVQMPPGIPVATVGVDGGANAAWLALRILSLHDPVLQKKLQDEKDGMKKKLLYKTQKIREKWENES